MMKYLVIHNEQEHVLELRGISGNFYECRLGDRIFRVEVQSLNEYEIIFRQENGDLYRFAIDTQVRSCVNVKSFGYSLALQVLDPRAAYRYHLRHQIDATSGFELSCPMPGKVVAILVQEGEQVQVGQGLIVIEAMKMENELKAPSQGVIKKITVAVGDAVESHMILIRAE